MSFLQYIDDLENYNSPSSIPQVVENDTFNINEFPQDLQSTFKKGGKVRKRDQRKLEDIIKSGEALRRKGRGEDTILAHINPTEAEILKSYGGSGTINPNTGLPEFGFFQNPVKATKAAFKSPKKFIAEAAGTLGPIVGAMTGNPFIGGAAGKSLRAAMLGGDVLPAALEGGVQGLGVSGLGSVLNWGGNALGSSMLSALGSNLSGQGALGAYNLSNLGTGAFGKEGFSGSGVSAGDGLEEVITPGPKKINIDPKSLSKEQLANMSNDELSYIANRKSLMDTLTPKSFTDKAFDYATKPEVLFPAATLGLSLYNSHLQGKEAKKAAERERAYNEPEAIADRKRRYSKAMTLSPEEIEANNKYLELLAGRPPVINDAQIRPLYRKKRAQDEYDQDGNWFDYYENPEMVGAPISRKEGGVIQKTSRSLESVMTPEGGYEIEQNNNDEPTIIRIISGNIMPQESSCSEERDNILQKLLCGFIPQMNDAEVAASNHGLNNDNQSNNVNHLKGAETVAPRYLDGDTGGQDDKIPALLSDGEYVIDASTVSDLGDGNSKAGADKLNKMVKAVRKKKRKNDKLPPKSGDIMSYINV